jgi:hypothetical protein
MVEDMGSILQKVGFLFCHWQSHKQYILSFTVLVLPRWICLRCKSQLDNIRCVIFFECRCSSEHIESVICTEMWYNVEMRIGCIKNMLYIMTNNDITLQNIRLGQSDYIFPKHLIVL